MSVVGPRPHFVEHAGQFAQQERYHIRSFVKPGVTGLAQVNGCRGEVRHPSDMERRVQWALNAQAGALERAADAIIRKTARRVGFRS